MASCLASAKLILEVGDLSSTTMLKMLVVRAFSALVLSILVRTVKDVSLTSLVRHSLSWLPVFVSGTLALYCSGSFYD